MNFEKYGEIFKMFEGGGECVGVGVTRVVPNIDRVANHILCSAPKARIVTVTEMRCTVPSEGRRTRPFAGRNRATTSPWRGWGLSLRLSGGGH